MTLFHNPVHSLILLHIIVGVAQFSRGLSYFVRIWLAKRLGGENAIEMCTSFGVSVLCGATAGYLSTLP